MMTNTDNSEAAQSLMSMLHHFGNFVASIDDTKAVSDMYIDTLANTK